MERKETIKKAFGEHLQKLRTDKGHSIRALAGRSGLEYSQVQRIEGGKVNVALTSIYSLAEGLEVEPGELLKVVAP